MRQSIEGLRLELAEYQKANAERKKDDVGTINVLLALSQDLLNPSKTYTASELQAAKTSIQSKSDQKKSGVFNVPLINKVLNFSERCFTYRAEKEAADLKAAAGRKSAEEQQARLAREEADRKAAEEERARQENEAATQRAAEEQTRLAREAAERKSAEELAERSRKEAAERQRAELAREASAREADFLTRIKTSIDTLRRLYIQHGGNPAKADKEIFNMTGVTLTDRAAMTAKFIAIVQKLREGKPGKASSKTLPDVPKHAEALGIELPAVTATAAPQSRWANFAFAKKDPETQKKAESGAASTLTM